MADKSNIDVTRPSLPPFRRLRVYAFDPSLETQLENAVINQVTLQIPWESQLRADEREQCDGDLQPGPVGDYIEVVDFDPVNDCFYAPVDLNDKHLLAQDGLAPSESDPRFHQQMVYAVAMTTIKNFERALGRMSLWAPRYSAQTNWKPEFVRRLRIYPHALRQANAFYSPVKKALLFGYFIAKATDPGREFPGGMVFTCLSHDVIVHETTHALLDGLHRRFIEVTNPDALAFHEAFSDIVALFQHFSFPEVLRHQIARTRGNLARQNMLGELAQQFGRATGARGALRSALGEEVNGVWRPKKVVPGEYLTITQPHERGSHLVAAVFDAFVSIYKSRVADLLRIATGGTGNLPRGQINPDLVNRMAGEAAASARHVLQMCIRALDYCPPSDLTFGEYLRALITADYDLVPDDDRGYRIAVTEAFRRRGIFPCDVRTLSEHGLRWHEPTKDEQSALQDLLPDPTQQLSLPVTSGRKPASRKPRRPERTHSLLELLAAWNLKCDRKTAFEIAHFLCGAATAYLRNKLSNSKLTQAFRILGLDRSIPTEELTVDSIYPARRLGPDGQTIVEMVVEITQRLPVFWGDKPPSHQHGKLRLSGKGYVVLDRFTRDPKNPSLDADMWFRGGCTLLINPASGAEGANAHFVRYAIVKNIGDENRLQRQVDHVRNAGTTLRATYFGTTGRVEESEAFAMLHFPQPQENPDVADDGEDLEASNEQEEKPRHRAKAGRR